MWERLEVEERPELHDGVLLVLLSTMAPQYRALYSHARELSKYMLHRMEFRKIATLYSSSLPPAVAISEEGTATLNSNSFYYHAGRRPILILAGDGSPMDDQYQYAHSVLSFAQQLGVKLIISVGARWTEPPAPVNAAPRVVGFATDSRGVAELERNGVTVTKNEPGPFFANLIVGMAEGYGMEGYKLGVDHGEPIPHPRSLIQILGVLTKIAQFEIGTKELEERASEMDKEVQPGAVTEFPRERGGIYG